MATRDRKFVPRAHREAISAELRSMLEECSEVDGKRSWNETKLARKLNISQAAINRAKHPHGVGPSLVDGFRRLGKPVEDLMTKHGIPPESDAPADPEMLQDLLSELTSGPDAIEDSDIAERSAEAAVAFYHGLRSTPFRMFRLARAIADHIVRENEGTLQPVPLSSKKPLKGQ